MNRLLPCLFALMLALNVRSQSPALTYTNVTGSNSITCSTQTINLTASVSNYTAPLSFAWSNGGAPLTGSNVNITSAGQYTLVAYNIANSFSLTQVIAIGMNVTAPSSVISPIFQNISCLVSAQTVTAVSNPTTNVTHNFYAPGGGIVSVFSYTAIYVPGAPGTYTHCVINNLNGCSTCKTFTVASTDNFPLTHLTSTNNFSLSCGNPSMSPISMSGTATTNPAGALTYTVLYPGFSGQYGFGNITNYALTFPGTFTAIIKDASNNCESKIPFTIFLPDLPVINYSVPVSTLTCYTPSVTLHASSPDATTTFSWSYYSNSGLSGAQGSNFVVNTTTNVTSPVNGNYTLTGINPLNSCKTSSVIPIKQNLFPPKAVISGGFNASISCNTQSIQLANGSTTGIPPATGFPTNSIVAAYLWEGPVPQQTVGNSATYVAFTPGVYTLTAMDYNNGCTSQTVTTVSDNRLYPVVVSPPPFQINCQSPTFVIYPNIIGNPANLTYTWNAGVTGMNSPSLTINTNGIYTVIVTNTVNGCATSATVGVDVCTGLNKTKAAIYDVHVFPNPGNGLYTLTVDNRTNDANIAIYNMLGTLVKTQAVDSETTVLDLKNEPNGIYFITVTDKNKIVHTSKVVKQ